MRVAVAVLIGLVALIAVVVIFSGDHDMRDCVAAERALGESDNLAQIECDRRFRQSRGETTAIVNEYSGLSEVERNCIDEFKKQGLSIVDTSAVSGLPVGSADQPFDVTFTAFYSDKRPATRARCKGQMHGLNAEVTSATMGPL